MAKNEISDYKQLIRQAKLARFERLSLAAGLEAERQGLTEEELEVEEGVPDPSPKEVERNLHLGRDPKDVPIALAAISAGLDYFVTNERPHYPRRDHYAPHFGKPVLAAVHSFLAQT